MNEEVLILIDHTHARKRVVPGDVITVSAKEAEWMERNKVAERRNNPPSAPAAETVNHEPQPMLEKPDTSKVNMRKK